MTERRIVATGLGLFSSLGSNLSENWENLKSGRSGIRSISKIRADGIPSRVAAEAPPPSLKYLSSPETTQIEGMAWSVIEEALQNARLDQGALKDTRVGLSFSTGSGTLEANRFVPGILNAIEEKPWDFKRLLQAWQKAFPATISCHREAGFLAGSIARQLGILGPVLSPLTACSAGTQAIGEAMGLIRDGDADVVVTGGSDSRLSTLSMVSYCLLGALCTDSNEEPEKASRPFDASRSGFVVGEGAGALVLESLEHARDRGAPIFGELIGFGSSSDAFRVTDPHPEGKGAISAMRAALQDACVSPSQIDWINAHGTSTQANDRIEALAINRVFGEYGSNIPVTSFKSMIGHTTAAAGAIECVGTILSLVEGLIPPTINTRKIDPQIDLNVVMRQAQKADIEVALSNSFGFGGQNATLIIRRWDEGY